MKPFIPDIEAARAAYNIPKSLDFGDIKEHINACTERYILGPMGLDRTRAEYLTDLLDSGTPTDDETAIIIAFQSALMAYTLAHAMPILQVKITNAGVMEQQSSNGTVVPVRQWVTKGAIEALWDSADALMENAMRLNEADCDACPDADLIWLTSQVQKHVNINSSRRVLLAILPQVRYITDSELVHIVGREQIDELLDHIRTNAITTDEQTLLNAIHPALACLAVARAIPEINAEIRSGSLTIAAFADGRTGATDTALSVLMRAVEARGQSYLSILKKFLDDNSADYPLHEASDAYSNDTPAALPREQGGRRSFRV